MKLILDENLFEDNREVILNNEPEKEVKVDVESIPLSAMLNQLIKSEWDAIDLYNGMLASLVEENDNHVVEVINDIISEEYVHVGQLEKLLQDINPVAVEIEAGKGEAEKDQGSSLEAKTK